MALFDSVTFPVRIKIGCVANTCYQDIITWGQATLGEHKVAWDMLYIEDNNSPKAVIYAGFKNEEDAMMFRLRWSA